MTRIFPAISFFILLLTLPASGQTIEVIRREAEKRVDIRIDGKPFTSYRWEERIKRPVLLPIMTEKGNFITRGFPIETRPGETVGHPHQVGLSFSYGDVNGIDFWNNSDFRTPKELERMGKIVHRRIVDLKSGKNRGALVIEADWILPTGARVLSEKTQYIFRTGDGKRWVDRVTTLTAAAEKVVFGDNKEGLFALHLARELQQGNQFPVKIIDALGGITEARTGEGLSGEYLNSEALTGEKIWGTLGRWASVSGKIENEEVTVAIFDHAENPNFPSSMMVRPYGLLALNPFGRKAFDPRAEARKFVLEPGKKIAFKHRLLILADQVKAETIEREYREFIK